MSTRDLALAIVAVVSIIATSWLLHDGTGADAIAPIIHADHPHGNSLFHATIAVGEVEEAFGIVDECPV